MTMTTGASHNGTSAVGVPVPLTALVGRRGEVTGIRRRLTASRLVTLTGVGGVGKTRLAFQVAATVVDTFPDGVHTVELAALRDGKLLAQGIAGALGLRGVSARDLHDVVVEHLRTRRLLLVLDNCEHLIDACAGTVDALLRAAPGLSVLTTSRQALGVTGEQVVHVPALATPEPGGRRSARDIGRFPAVALFEQRAAAVRPGFTVDAENAGAVAELVHRLEGLPLAIELAAARMRTLTVPEILARLDDRYALLTLGSRAALPRQRTLRELIGWSYALCTARERALWERASVFAGGFDLPAAEAVCSGDGLPREAVVDAVDGLVEKSVLIREEDREENGGRSRYRMLETIREYGREQLAGEDGEVARLRRRHRDYFLDLTVRAEREWFGPRQAELLTRRRHDHANLRAALEFCLETPGETAQGMVLAVAPRHYWITLGSLEEGRHWLSRLLEAGPAADPGRAAALATRAYLEILQGAVEDALPILDEARSAAEQEGDRAASAWIRHHRGVVATWRQELPEAAALFTAAAAGLRALGDVGGATECTMKRALVAAALGDGALAARLGTECEAVTSAHGESWVGALTHFVRALAAWTDGDHGTAAAEARTAVRGLRPFNDWWDMAMCVELVAQSAAAAGDAHRAAELFGILHTLWKTIGGTLSAPPFLLDSHRHHESAVREKLGARAYDRAYRSGAGRPVPSAMAYVLGEEQADAPARVLTRREGQVADLVAAGLTNKEIAVRLTITLRTAENHVERILAKLGFRSRTQLAVWRNEQGDN
ncbi:LuxR family transcriptional regulator [Streptomyces bluensis]|nr:LuxR family transcriptional regulator [Streptomyces bluensis]